MPVLKIKNNGVWEDIVAPYGHSHTVSDITDIPENLVDDVESLKAQSENLATKTYVQEEIEKVNVSEQLADYALKTEIPSIEGLATESYVNEQISNIDVPEQVQADWLEDDQTSPSYIKNKPNISVDGSLPVPESASVGQYLQISGVDENGAITSMTTVDTVASDWETMANKPFYETEPVETELLPEQEFSFVENPTFAGLYCSMVENVQWNLSGEKYAVTWDNETYMVTSAYYAALGGHGIGNASLLGLGDDTGEPFAIGVAGMSDTGNTIALFAADTTTTHTVAIKRIVPAEVHTIDSKYLPETTADWNTMSNKPFGDIDVTETTLLEEELPFVYYEIFGCYAYAGHAMTFAFVEGQDYIVVWDNETYTRTAFAFTSADGSSCIAVGNPLAAGLEANDDKFAIVCDTSNEYLQFLSLESTNCHSIVISQIVGGIKKIDEKYLPILDYIPPVETDILPHTEFTCDSEVYMPYNKYGVYVASMSLEIGKEYTVVLDNVEYKCVAQDASAAFEGAVVLGNGSDYGFDGNNEPFGIVYAQDTETLILTYDDTEPSLSHTVRIYQVANDGGYKLKEKYLPEISSISSWNDLTDKPFGEENGLIDLRPLVTYNNFTLNSTYNLYCVDKAEDYSLVIGETYVVFWDGNEYECVAQNGDALLSGSVLLGNLSAFELSGNNEPFIIGNVGGYGSQYYSLTDTEAGGSHEVRIAQRGIIVNKIDSKYLHQSDWNENDASKGTYILNKPFGKKLKVGSVLVDEDAILDDENAFAFPNSANELLIDGTAYEIVISDLFGTEIYRNSGRYISGVEIDSLGMSGTAHGDGIATNDDSVLFVSKILGTNFLLIIQEGHFGLISGNTYHINIAVKTSPIKQLDNRYLSFIDSKALSIIPETKVPTICSNNVWVTLQQNNTTVEHYEEAYNLNGEDCLIIIDGEEYLSKIFVEEESVYFGNIGLIADGYNTGESFIGIIDKFDNADGTSEAKWAFGLKDKLPTSDDEVRYHTFEVILYPNDGTIKKEYLPDMLPEVTTSDAGKFLRVSANGKWIAESIPNAEEASF